MRCCACEAAGGFDLAATSVAIVSVEAGIVQRVAESAGSCCSIAIASTLSSSRSAPSVSAWMVLLFDGGMSLSLSRAAAASTADPRIEAGAAAADRDMLDSSAAATVTEAVAVTALADNVASAIERSPALREPVSGLTYVKVEKRSSSTATRAARSMDSVSSRACCCCGDGDTSALSCGRLRVAVAIVA